MTIAATSLLADGWSMHNGNFGWWWILMIPFMVLFMGGMMWMMMRGMGGSSSSGTRDKETPVEIIERRFAEGAISREEYQARREALVNGSSGSNGAHKDEPLIANRTGEGRQ